MRLIDILNKIANGELKEGAKVKWDVYEYTYKKGDCYDEYLERKVDKFNYVDIIDDMALRHLNTEVELIEPQEPTECEHEWKRYSLGRLGQRTENHRYCSKCGADEIEPTDNTKIEELDENKYVLKGMADIVVDTFYKLNEVIRYINK